MFLKSLSTSKVNIELLEIIVRSLMTNNYFCSKLCSEIILHNRTSEEKNENRTPSYVFLVVEGHFRIIT